MIRKGRSPATIAGYADHIERIVAAWGQRSLRSIADDPASVAARHDEISTEHGPYIANGSMRTLRAIYNHALKTNLDLPARNLSLAVDWNGRLLGWLVGHDITPYVPVIDRTRQRDGFFDRAAFRYDREADAYRCPADKPLGYMGAV